ncbi:calcium-translocating P-type ATPase, SERCA-type [Candidatus Woesearchaeota archaeon]|nr:calcium-translocating P-type ATPase, SERCA-type [Candidatus Woesearchaeota archaeon]
MAGDAYYNKTAEQVLKELGSSIKGLADSEAAKRLEKYGPNEIKEEKKISGFQIFINQFKSFIVYILIAAVIISVIIPIYEEGLQNVRIMDFVDAIAIFVILVLNSVMGFLQEYKAEEAIEALKKLTSLKALVIRNGHEKEIDAKDIVPGDIIALEVGQKIPADSRLVSIHNLEVQEAALTGESTPVRKILELIKGEKVIANRTNMAFAGTIVTRGRATAVVAHTGMTTEIGKIATQIQEAGKKITPLQEKLGTLGHVLGILTIFICIAVVLGGVLKGGHILEWLIIGVSLAVAAIPEGLPAVVTISLALGVQRMVKRNALIRHLPSVETLGSTTVICTDKTGTLTKNEMTVRKVYVNKNIIDATGTGYHPEGKFVKDGKTYKSKELEMLLKIGVLCNDSNLTGTKVIGDPTEACLLVSAKKIGLMPHSLRRDHLRLDENEFTSERKMMSTLNKEGNKHYVFSKGAPEILLKKCGKILENGKTRKITKKDADQILKQNKEFAEKALRVLGFAYKESKKLDEKDLIFVGLQAMMDPPREEVKAAVKKCHDAGIRVIMITGDYEVTAKAIAEELGIHGESINGEKLREIQNLSSIIDKISVFARVNPEDKLKIVDALKEKGEIVAMTGDGVNDAPALKKADIGIAMGITGTDVAKEAADMILTDDNFASIVGAIEEGRGIFDNIKKFVNYLLSANMGEVLILFIAMLIGFSVGGSPVLPLIAIQILWINLITDGLPALALGVDPISPGIMKRLPRSPKAHIISKDIVMNITILGIMMTATVIWMFSKYLPAGLSNGQTVAFTLVVLIELVWVYVIKENYGLGLFSNWYLLAAICGSLLLQLSVIYTPLSSIFRTTAIGLAEWGWIAGICAGIFAVGIIANQIIRRATKEID